MASSKEIKTAEDIKGLTIGIKNNPIFADMAEAFGANYNLILESDKNEIKSLSSNSDTVQTTLSRYYLEANNKIHKHVTNTQHNLYLTTIVINDAFWNSLSIEDQMVIKQASLNSARKERAWSIEDAENIAKSKQEKEKLGIQSYHELPETEVNKLKDSATKVHEKYDSFFSTGLIKSIINS
jgi:TRAP-type C4-dicarboxylate transport system substrate-binding protein